MQYLVGALNVPAETVFNERGTHVGINRKQAISEYFTDKDVAITEAKKKAGISPGTQYAVFGVLSVYETTTPKIIEKTINDAGELVLKPEQA